MFMILVNQIETIIGWKLFFKKQKKHTTFEVFSSSYLVTQLTILFLRIFPLSMTMLSLVFLFLAIFILTKMPFPKRFLSFYFSTQSDYFNETLWKLHKGLSNLRSHLVGLEPTINNGLTSSLSKSKNVQVPPFSIS